MQGANRSILVGVGRILSKGRRPYNLPIFRGMAKCKSGDEGEAMERQGISCRRPDLRRKAIAPYKYGFCREPDVPMMMSCPKTKKGSKSNCCHDEGPESKGGCKRPK